jgi:hypothetical protein
MSWAGDTIWDLLKIIFEVVAPGAMPYLQKVGGAIKKIFKDPISFVGNLVQAGKLGFQNFASNIGTHLKKAFLEWLTGSLPGVYIPKSLTLKEFVKLALSVLGLTWDNIRQKLVKATSETVVKGLEMGFEIVKKLITEGPAAAWEEIKSQLSNLKDMVMQGIMDYIIETVVKKAVAKVLSLLVPGGAFIQAIISIYDTVMVFIAKLKKIIQVAMAFLDSMMAIANGQLGAAAAKVESVLAGLLTLAISFLAGFLGLGKIADKVMNIINTKVRAPVDKAIDFVINWIVTTAKRLFAALFKKDAKPDERTPAQKQADLDKAIAEAQSLQKTAKITEAQIKKGLLSIKQKYRMVSLELVVDTKDQSKETVHVEGEINPTKKTAKSDLETEKPAQQAHDEVMAKMSDSNKKLLHGHGGFIGGHAGRGFSTATRDTLDAIGYATGDHSFPSIKDPGTKGDPATVWGKKGMGNWIPDHQPPDTLAGGGASLSFRFYPHSQSSARQQGGAVRVYKMWMKEARKRDDSNWSEGVQSGWFW